MRGFGWVLIVAFGLVASGCGRDWEELANYIRGYKEDPDSDEAVAQEPGHTEECTEPPMPKPLPHLVDPTLRLFSSCQEVEAYIEDRMVAKLHRWYGDYEDDGLIAYADSTSAATESFSKTNNQVEGVEEDDWIKSDGTYLYQLTAKTLRITKAFPGDEMNLVATLEVSGHMKSLMLAEDKLVLLGSPDESEIPEALKTWTNGFNGRAAESFIGQDTSYGYTKLVLVDISKRHQPSIEKTYVFSGRVQGARRVRGSVKLVLSGQMDFPMYEFGEQAEADIRNQSLSSWMSPGGAVLRQGKEPQVLSPLGDCRHIYVPQADTELGLSRIVTIPLDEGDAEEIVMLSRADHVYMSETNLYVSTLYDWLGNFDPSRGHTFIHRFDVSSPYASSYAGTGGVPGSLLNQFAMDEFEGVLRVASTVTANDGSGIAQDDAVVPPVYGLVSTLHLSDGSLDTIGTSEHLAEGERIYAVRFQRERGYVVTFREVDPLYTLDLRDPRKPEVVGELKIPGYSSYIHMMDDHHLLTIGRAGDDQGVMRGLKLSIFDVSDIADPREIHSFELDEDMGSEAEYDHKAFAYFPDKSALAIPTYHTDAQWNYKSDLHVFQVDLDQGISKQGSLDLDGLVPDSVGCEPIGFQEDTYARGLFIGDYLYGVGAYGIHAAPWDDVETPVSTVRY